MAATTTNRDTRACGRSLRVLPVAANVDIPAGVIVGISTTTGLADNATAAATVRVMGVSACRVNNTGGAAAAKSVTAERGVYGPFANSASADQVVAGDIGADCYVVDNQTVAKTSSSGTRPRAGTVFGVETAGVWVEFA